MRILRIILSLLLLYGVYTETGIWTVSVLFLIMVDIEGTEYLKAKRNRQYKGGTYDGGKK